MPSETLYSCLQDIIGLSPCESESPYDLPASGFYITSLPGISLESIEKVATEDQATYRGLWRDCQRNALDRFKQDILTGLKKCYNLNKECDYEEMICENTELLIDPLKYLLGSWLMLYRLTSNRLNRYTTLDKEEAAELKAFYDAEYNKSLSQAILLMDTTGCELCCGGNPEVVIWLP